VQPLEIIIINNGKTELELDEIPLLSISRVFNVIHFIGAAQARNIGAIVSAGDYIAYLDDDDLWERLYIEKVIKMIREDKPDCIITRLDTLINDKVSEYKNADNNLIINEILIRNPGITGSSIVVKRDSFFKVSGFDPKLPPSEDKSLVLELLLNNFKVMSAPHIQSIIRQHQDTRMTEAVKMVEGISQFLRKYRSLMNKKQYYFNTYKLYYRNFLYKKNLLYFILYNYFKVLSFLH
jgi:glycosyltransferase involved in cell wall biosynthesis